MQTNTIAASGQDKANARKERVALFSILASAGITVGKLVAGLLSGSLALLSEAAHALVDTGATIITYFAVRAANKPADREHHYGHGKFESLAALAETVILFMLSGVVVVQAIERLAEGGGHFEPTPLAFAVLLVSIAVDVNRVRSLRKVAKETGSQALAADALHFASDLAGSGLVLLGLGAAVFGFRYGDALAAIGVAGFIAIAGWRLGRQTLDTLLDAAPKGASDRIAALVAQVPGVVEPGELRLRSGGAESFGEMTVFVSRTLSLDRAGLIKEQILSTVRAEYPRTSLTVVVVPRALDNETVFDRIMLTAARRRVPVHHVTVQDIGPRMSIGLDIEVDGGMSLEGAHGVASRFEAALRDEFGADTEVETHIEPLRVAHLPGQEATTDIVHSIATLIADIAAATGTLLDVHNVRVRNTPAGLAVMYHFRAEPSLDVQHVHDCMDRLEHKLRIERPDIIRAVGHAEPMRPVPV